MVKKSKSQKLKAKSLIWVYPPDKWISNYNKTFVYGWSNPKAKLFVSVEAGLKPASVKIFPNGNFAQTINLPKKENIVRLIQILNEKKKVITRHVIAREPPRFARGKLQQPKQSHNVRRLLRRHFMPPRNDKVIVIDPGHGGKEHGTHSPKGIPEKVFNLEIAKLLVETLRATSLPVKIYLTRTKDTFVSLKERVNFAKKKKCNLLISIHHNALPDNEDPLKHKGVGIYYTHNFVKPFAKALLKKISKSSGLKQYGIFKRNFALTRPDFCYAVLIECGFLIHPLEVEFVTKKDTQEKIVRGITEGLRSN